MNIILLGGNNVGNKKWIEAVEKRFKPHFSTHTLSYKHWETGSEWINPEEELKRLAEMGERLKDYVIFARSAGTMITLMGNARKYLRPQSCIFVGISIKWSSYFDPDYDSWLRNFDNESLVIQKTNDPAISCTELRSFLSKRNFKNYHLKELAGEDHYYGNIDELVKLSINFINRKGKQSRLLDQYNFENQHSLYSSLR